MNRDIRIRAWDASTKKMLYGHDIEETLETYKDDDGDVFERGRYLSGLSYGEVFVGFYNYSGDWEECDVMQFTGLRDKNGNQIYEGDVVKWLGYEVANNRQMRPGRWIVVGQGYIAPKIKPSNFINDCYYLQNLILQGDKSIEVIGNIHENPDLLEGLKC